MVTSGNMLADSTNTTDVLIYIEGTFTPTVTLVGGAGNTVPVYTTNTGRYTRIGNRVFGDILLNGDGGDDGAGTGVVNIALPVTAGASKAAPFVPVGYVLIDAGTEDIAYLQIDAGATTLKLYYIQPTVTFDTVKGSAQANANRTIQINFFYEV